ncbi:hypothetical protein NPIL_242951, partial [Nephila pilipes]
LSAINMDRRFLVYRPEDFYVAGGLISALGPLMSQPHYTAKTSANISSGLNKVVFPPWMGSDDFVMMIISDVIETSR